MQAYPETIKAQPLDERGLAFNTIEVEIRGDRRAVRCGPVYQGVLTVYDLACRFPTGSKVWPASAHVEVATGRVYGLAPSIDKRTRNQCSLVGFFEDFDTSSVRSHHVGA